MITSPLFGLSVLGFVMLGFICNRLHCILQELRKQTALSREARDFVKARSKEQVMHSPPKVTYS